MKQPLRLHNELAVMQSFAYHTFLYMLHSLPRGNTKQSLHFESGESFCWILEQSDHHLRLPRFG
jgi:hypothetical protein